MSRPSSLAALVLLPLVAAPAAFADSPSLPSPAVATSAPGSRVTGDSPLARYAGRLEAEAARILNPEVGGPVKTAVRERAVELWASLTVSEWGQRVIAAAPSLAKAVPVLVRRTEVLWAEERVVDAYGSPVLQQASVHALMRGMGRVMESLGHPLPPPPPPPPPTPTPSYDFGGNSGIVGSMRPMPAPTAAPAARPAPRPAPKAAAPAPAPAAGLVSPAQVETYKAALTADAARILKYELEGAVLEAAVARKGQLRAQPTVAGWEAALVKTSPSLAKAAAVLVRRTEVLRTQSGVVDAYEHPLVQRAAVIGLQTGLEKVMAQFGK
jgi:hypothetical protein